MKTTISPVLRTSAAVATAAAVACLACALCLAGCSKDDSASRGAIAATVGDETIYEDDVTALVESMRAQYGYTDDYTWALVLTLSGLTPEDYREYIIDSLSLEKALPVAAAQKNITVDAADVDAAVAEMQQAYGLSDEQWATALSNSGYTAESYREAVEQAMIKEALYTEVTADATVTDEIFEEYGMPYVEAYFPDIKRSSHILFASDDKENAEKVLAELEAGTITFEDAVATYSIDTGSAENGGDVGWSGVNTFVDEYQTALDELAVGEMSGLVESQFGYHIILCTDAFTYSEDMKTADVPEDVYDLICVYFLNSNIGDIVFDKYITEVRDGMGYVINPMPEGLSYDVDMAALLASDDEGGESAESSEASGSTESAESAGSASTEKDAA